MAYENMDYVLRYVVQLATSTTITMNESSLKIIVDPAVFDYIEQLLFISFYINGLSHWTEVSVRHFFKSVNEIENENDEDLRTEG